MRRLACFATVVLFLGAAGAAGAPRAFVQPVWLAPVELTPHADSSIWDEVVAVDGGGDALAVWSGPGGLRAAFRPAGGTWEAAVQFAACGWAPTAAFDASATATVVWIDCADRGSRVTTAFRGLHNGWSEPVALSTPGREAWFPKLAVAQSGAAVASWGESDGRQWVVEAATRASILANAWAPAVQLSSVGADAYDSWPAIDDTGDAIVGWTRGDPAGAIVWTAFKPSGGGWQQPVNLSPPGSVATAIAVAIRAGGDAFAVWDENGEGRTASRSAATGAWSPSESFPGYDVHELAVSRAGDVLVVWGANEITADEIPAGTSAWGPPFRVSSQQLPPSSYAVEFDGSRGLVALWSMQDQTGNGFIGASRRSAGAAEWDPPVVLPIPGTFNNLYNAAYGVDDVGDAVAGYATSFGSSAAAVVLDAAPPRLAWLRFSRAGRVGQKLSFAAGPVDISAVSFRWSFGDGRNATGQSVTHVYRRAGRFRVDLVATDEAGHTGLVSRTSVRISPRRRSSGRAAARASQWLRID